jgi:hypothetical protein
VYSSEAEGSQKLLINTKAQRSPLGLDTIPLSPTNFMNALILGAPSFDCKLRPQTFVIEGGDKEDHHCDDRKHIPTYVDSQHNRTVR